MNPTSFIPTFLLRHRLKIAVVAGLLLLAGFSFGLGRIMASERIEYRERLQVLTVEKERIVWREKAVETKTTDRERSGKTTKKTTEVERPDGTKEKTTEETTEEKEAEKQIEIRYVDRVVEKQVEVVKQVDKEVEKIVEKPLPDWRISPMVGLNVPGLLQDGLSDRQLVFGIEGQRRIVGPLSAGVWGLSNGAVGVSLSLEF
jgi:hypothetical protein